MRRSLSVLLLSILSLAARAQISFTGEYTNNFDNYLGSAATLPTGWTTSGTGSFQGLGNGSGTTGGFYAFLASATPLDRSLGALHSGTATGSYIVTFTNGTGSTITALNMSYDFKQFRSVNTSGWAVSFNGGATDAVLSANGVATGITTGVPAVTNKSETLTGLSIASGATFTITWTVTDATGSDNPIGVDNFKMCIPGNAFSVTATNSSPTTAPSPVTLTGSATLGTTPYAYSWAGPLSYSATESSPVINPSATTNSGTYTLTVTDALNCTASATTSVTVTPGSGCSGTPVSGTAAAIPSSLCGSGTSTLTVSGASSASGLTYQWQSSPTGATGTFTDISGATDVIYNSSTITATTYYQLITTCTSSTLSDISTIASVTVNPLPTITAPGGNVCSGGSGLSITATGASTYSWAPATGLSATTGATVTANPAYNVTYTVTGTSAAGCVNTTTVPVTYNITPSAPSVTPSPFSTCLGNAPHVLTAVGGVVGPTTVNSGVITIPSSLGGNGTISNAITMAGVPAGAVITGASVNIINFGTAYPDDYVVNLTAPNGNVLNLVDLKGGHSSTVAAMFTNAIISSAGTTSLSTGATPFTSIWAADLVSAVGAAPYLSNVTAWSGLYSVPNGAWTLSIYNNTTFSNTVLTSAQWSLTLNYTYQTPVTWTPTTNLYTDAAGTIPYTGTATNTVYENPLAAGSTTYTVLATNNTCTVNATAAVTVNPPLGALSGTNTICQGQTTSLSIASTGGTWSLTGASVASVDGSGVVTGIGAGTATISYTATTSCVATIVITVNAVPTSISGATPLCEGAVETLSSTPTSGTWSVSNMATGTIDASSGQITGIAAGTTTVSYTTGNGCYKTTILTVNTTPAAITGTLTACTGATTTLSSTTPAGTWTSADATVATIDASGVVTGVAAGTSGVSYTTAGGCAASAIVTVNGAPAPISGTATVCEGMTTSLTDATTGGTWASSTPVNGTIDAAAGVAAGIAAGTTNITYTLPTGCYTTTVLTVNTTPAAITGTLAICQDATTSLSSVTPSGTWTSTLPAIASIDASGVATGVSAGTSEISYTLATGCFTTAILTVNPLPAAITGTTEVCQGSTTTLANATTGGTWSADPTTIADINTSGVVTGVTAGTATVTYALATGCNSTTTITIDPLPASITGTLAACQGLTTTVATTSTGGTWSSSDITVAPIDASGVITGSTAGTSTITYSLPTGCITTAVATVNPLPASITGVTTACVGLTTTLSSTTAGGTWSSSDATIASANATTGVITGAGAGTATITYMLATGCITTTAVTINPLPAAITGTLTVCEGLTTTLSDATTGGTWTSGTPANATIDAGGVVSGDAAGTSTVTYTLPTGCIATAGVTVIANPAPITGTLSVCQGSTTTLSTTAAGGTWSSSLPAVASIDASGVVTGVSAATTNITYTLPTGCITTAVATVNALPAAITGTLAVCQTLTTTLSSTTTGGTWTSSIPANATIDASGVVTGVAAGTSAITYALSTGCQTTAIATVNALPATITGTLTVCEGNTTTLANTTTGGSWSSSNGNAIIGSGTGIVTGATAGTSVISYTVPAGCYSTAVVTVNATPTAITGTAAVCISSTTTLASSAGGTWSSSNGNATIGSSTGVVTGATAGTSVITYEFPTGCLATKIVTVNALPGTITGATDVCVASTITLTGTGGGTWISSNTNAAVGSSTGVVMGVAGGASVITYMLATGCYTTMAITVNALPAIIGGTATVCEGATTTLTSSPVGTWASSNTNATIGSSTGVVTGATAGTSLITYTLPTGCYTTRIITVNALPGAITGASVVCAGAQITLSDAGTGTWNSGSANVSVAAATGIVTGVTAGTATVTYTLATGCAIMHDVTINALPSVDTVTGGGSYCAGGSGLSIGLSNSTTGILYQLYEGTTATGSTIAGTGSALDMGTYTDAGTYTIAATNSITGCAAGMSGSATIVVNPLLVPSISISSPTGDTICSGVLTTFSSVTANEGSAPIFQWSVNGVAVGSTSAYSYVPADGDILSVKLTSNATCATPDTASDTTNLTVITTVTPSVTAVAAPGLHVCAGTLITFTATPVNGGSAPAYRWTQNGINVATGPTYMYAPENGDNIYCMLFSNQRCRTNDSIMSSTVTLTVDSPGTLPVVSIAAHPGLTITAGQSDTLVATASAGVSYQWMVNGLPIAGATDNSYVNSSFANNDTVTCVVTNNTVCAESNSAHVVINVTEGVAATNAINALTIMPNPNNGTFAVVGSVAGDGDVQFAVTNLLGQCVYTQNAQSKNGQINAQVQLPQSIADGTYLITVRFGNTASTHRIVVSKQ